MLSELLDSFQAPELLDSPSSGHGPELLDSLQAPDFLDFLASRALHPLDVFPDLFFPLGLSGHAPLLASSLSAGHAPLLSWDTGGVQPGRRAGAFFLPTLRGILAERTYKGVRRDGTHVLECIRQMRRNTFMEKHA